MHYLIPEKYQNTVKQGLETKDYFLKICGAGGGGFIIGFTKNDAELPSSLGGLDVKELMKF